jgi:acetyl esterase/lipase
VPVEKPVLRAFQVSDAERLAKYEAAYESGDLLIFGNAYADILVDERANESVCAFLRGKIRSIVKDPALAETLTPKDHFYGTKRPCIDTRYFETFNLPHVQLVDLRREPIATVTETGIDTVSRSFEFDVIVYATGFDAMTGAIVAVDVAGRDGLALKQKWDHGPRTYLGLMTTGFPNFFTITGPGSPSVLSNMVVSIEQHVDWIRDCLVRMREEHLDTIEPTQTAEDAWVQHVNDCADITLLPRANSWYMGANVPGKPRVFLPYIGGVDRYRKVCDDVVARGWLGFAFDGRDGRCCNDGVVRRLQPDAEIFLELLQELGAPRIETLSVADARAYGAASNAMRPPGPEVGEVRDGELAGAAGALRYRLYRPATPGPHGIVTYFHGGGWVLGDLDSDDPFCRFLCVHADAIVVSVDYRHAPEARFPAAADDAFAAVRWIAAHAAELGGTPGRVVVCGWSAGGNVAAVACRLARDAGGPAIAGQVLITPVTDCDWTRASYVENGEGYFLTTPLMRWFWEHYADPADRTDPKASPLRAGSLAGLPPALVVTCEFDPLRDEGAAYAAALAQAGVPARELRGRGMIHMSVPGVDVMLSANGIRHEIADTLRTFLGGAETRAATRTESAPAAHA